MSLRTYVIRLRDGRSLGYAEHGDPSGTPVFFFHGTPGSRMLRHPDESIALSLCGRIITIDRPGFGLSDFKPRRLLDWPDDVIELADALQIDHFAIAGFSGGGPHAAACAFKISSRVSTVALISSLAPPDHRGESPNRALLKTIFHLGRLSPLLLRTFAWPFVRGARRDFDKYLDRVAARLPECDAKTLLRPDVRAVFRESFAEFFRTGSRGAAAEIHMLTQPWGFHLRDISVKAHLWHGEQDVFQKPHTLVDAVPHVKVMLLPDQGHLLLFNHWQEILTQMLKG